MFRTLLYHVLGFIVVVLAGSVFSVVVGASSIRTPFEIGYAIGSGFPFGIGAAIIVLIMRVLTGATEPIITWLVSGGIAIVVLGSFMLKGMASLSSTF